VLNGRTCLCITPRLLVHVVGQSGRGVLVFDGTSGGFGNEVRGLASSYLVRCVKHAWDYQQARCRSRRSRQVLGLAGALYLAYATDRVLVVNMTSRTICKVLGGF